MILLSFVIKKKMVSCGSRRNLNDVLKLRNLNDKLERFATSFDRIISSLPTFQVSTLYNLPPSPHLKQSMSFNRSRPISSRINRLHEMTGKYHHRVVSTIEEEGGSELETVWRFLRPDKGQRVALMRGHPPPINRHSVLFSRSVGSRDKGRPRSQSQIDNKKCPINPRREPRWMGSTRIDSALPSNVFSPQRGIPRR